MNLFQAEKFAEDAFRVKRSYIDVAGDLNAGILLGQIVYWHLPARDGSKLTIERDGVYWLAKRRTDWWDEIRLTAKQYDRAIGILVEKGLVTVKLFHFNGKPTPHIRLHVERVFEGVKSILTFGENTFSPKGEMYFDEKAKSSYIQRLQTENTGREEGARATGSGGSPVAYKDSDAAEIVAAFFRAYGKTPNALQGDRILAFLDDGLESALIIHVMERSAIGGKPFNYTEAALAGIHRDGIRTLEEYQAAEADRRGGHAAKHRGRSERAGKQIGGTGYQHRNADFGDVDLSEFD